ncbi:DUF2520 domain-containing protein [bacterium]|nr:DUF2520 domain-containing protein [bacterium]
MNRNQKQKVAIVGLGKVGSVLLKGLMKSGYLISGLVTGSRSTRSDLNGFNFPVHERIADLEKSIDFIILSVAENRIADLSAEIVKRGGFHPSTVVAHTAGALSSSVLESVREVGALPLSWHPMQTFVGGEGAELLEGITFGIEGDSEAVERGSELAVDLGGFPYIVPPGKHTIYHLGAVVACNLMSGLAGIAVRLLNDAGMTDARAMQALGPLMSRTAQNISDKGLPDAISGPHRRGDEKTINEHLRILEDYPEIGEVYNCLSRELLKRLGEDE